MTGVKKKRDSQADGIDERFAKSSDSKERQGKELLTRNEAKRQVGYREKTSEFGFWVFSTVFCFGTRR
jgi:hypothetical protein